MVTSHCCPFTIFLHVLMQCIYSSVYIPVYIFPHLLGYGQAGCTYTHWQSCDWADCNVHPNHPLQSSVKASHRKEDSTSNTTHHCRWQPQKTFGEQRGCDDSSGLCWVSIQRGYVGTHRPTPLYIPVSTSEQMYMHNTIVRYSKNDCCQVSAYSGPIFTIFLRLFPRPVVTIRKSAFLSAYERINTAADVGFMRDLMSTQVCLPCICIYIAMWYEILGNVISDGIWC